MRMDNVREDETFMSTERMLQRKLHLAQYGDYVYPGLESSWSQGLNSAFSLSRTRIIEQNMQCRLSGSLLSGSTVYSTPSWHYKATGDLISWGVECKIGEGRPSRELGLSADMIDEAKSTTCGVKILKYLTDPADTGRLNTLSISQGLGIFSCKGPGDKYFSLCRLCFAVN